MYRLVVFKASSSFLGVQKGKSEAGWSEEKVC